MFRYHPLIMPFTELEPDYFPAAELNDAVANQKKVTPLLLEALKDFSENPGDYSEEEGNLLHIVSIALLAQFREPEVLPVLLDIVKTHRLESREEDLEKVSAYEELIFSIPESEFSRILASVAGADVNALKALVLDDELDWFMRCRALMALKSCYFEGDIERSELVSFLSDLFDAFKSLDNMTEDYVFLWGELYDISINIHPGELLNKIKEACDNGIFEESSDSNLKEAEYFARKNFDSWFASAQEDLKEKFGYIRQVDAELEKWGMEYFTDPITDEIDGFGIMLEKARQRALLSETAGTIYRQVFREDSEAPFIREEPNVGRNDPCLCGSGKKFKKCCGR